MIANNYALRGGNCSDWIVLSGMQCKAQIAPRGYSHASNLQRGSAPAGGDQTGQFPPRKAYLFLLFGSFFLAAQAQAAPNMKDGMWEITTKVEIPNMPMPIPPTRHTQCLTIKDAIPQQQVKNSDCKMNSVKSESDSISWAMQCHTREGTLDGTGKVTYKGDSMDGVMTMNIKDSRQGAMQMIYRMSGKYLGACNNK